MDSTVSVSKGVFLFNSGLKKGNKSNKKKITNLLFEKVYKKELWYETYRSNWNVIESKLMDLHNITYSLLLNDVVNHIKECGAEVSALDGVIPSATLLTGVSQPDHVSQFSSLITILRDEVTPHVALTNSQDAVTIKHLIENTVWQLIHGHEALDIEYDDDDDFETTTSLKKIKKNQCTMNTLRNWYLSKYQPLPIKKNTALTIKSLVIIIPDFESFNCNVLQDFVMILSRYVSTLPIVIVFGVATSVSALHKSFPYHVSSKLLIKVFHSHSSPVHMNQVLEDIFLTHTAPFHLSGKAWGLLTDVFLFYDFSVTGLIQNVKYCMMEHFYGDNTKSLCCARNVLKKNIMDLKSDDLENIRRLMSFRPFLEQQDFRTKISLFEEDDFFRQILHKKMTELYDYLHKFYMCVRVLCVLIKNLPKNMLGRSVREIYTKCAVESITDKPEFKECMQLLKFQSKINLVESIKDTLKIVNMYAQDSTPKKPLRSPEKSNLNGKFINEELKIVRVSLLSFLRQLENASIESSVKTVAENKLNNENVPGNRYKLKETLLKATRVDKIQSEFEMIRSRFVSYLEDILRNGLQPPHTQTFYELLFFSDVSGVKRHIVGSPRGAIHTALSNPVHYLQCSCCNLSTCDSVANTLPDVCLAYKLHLECGKHINLYDWLQAFAAIIRREEDTEYDDPSIQRRFTRAIAELQYLGFIKSSKRKTDHVMRLTW